MPSPKRTNVANLAHSAAAPRCQHVKLNGQPCAAPAVKGRNWCLFHAGDYEGHFPTTGVPEDAATIQLEIARVIRQLQNSQISTKSASLILYALQVASMNLKRLGAEMPVAVAAPEDLVDDLYRRLDPLPEHALESWVLVKKLVEHSHTPYHPPTDDLDQPAAAPPKKR
jgi:hypothetical protein